MKRALSLHRETLAELGTHDLAHVVGAALPTKDCARNSELVCWTERYGSDCTCPTE